MYHIFTHSSVNGHLGCFHVLAILFFFFIYFLFFWLCWVFVSVRGLSPVAATWMDLEIIILSEVSQTEKGKYVISLICGIKKNDTSELIYKAEIDSQT